MIMPKKCTSELCILHKKTAYKLIKNQLVRSPIYSSKLRIETKNTLTGMTTLVNIQNTLHNKPAW